LPSLRKVRHQQLLPGSAAPDKMLILEAGKPIIFYNGVKCAKIY
jgi:hypothetical protein